MNSNPEKLQGHSQNNKQKGKKQPQIALAQVCEWTQRRTYGTPPLQAHPPPATPPFSVKMHWTTRSLLVLIVLLGLSSIFASETLVEELPEHEATVADVRDRGEPGPTIAVVRILGNDIPGRHGTNQTLSSLEFILQHEEKYLPRGQKIWVLNRIVDERRVAALRALLDAHDELVVEIPFSREKLLQAPYDLARAARVAKLGAASEVWRSSMLPQMKQLSVLEALLTPRLLYLANNNGARNVAITLGIASEHEWTLPMDGQCFFTPGGWRDVLRGMDRAQTTLDDTTSRHLIVPLSRIQSTSELEDGRSEEEWLRSAVAEPQVAFHRSSHIRFDPTIPYGARPKVDLLWRLGVPGPWDSFHPNSWERPRPPVASNVTFTNAGYAVRLPSGAALTKAMEEMQVSLDSEGNTRDAAIRAYRRRQGAIRLVSSVSYVLESEYERQATARLHRQVKEMVNS